MKRTSHETSSADRSPAPERSLTQRRDALRKANEVRSLRAMLKRDLKAGRVSIQSLLQEPPDYVDTAKVMDMLLAVPLYGRVKVNKVLRQCRISPSKTIGGLSERQRNELVTILGAPRQAQPPPRPASPAAAHRVPRVQPGPGALADEELARAVERLVEEARQVGRRAGLAVCDAGEKGHAFGPRPDVVGLQAALRATLHSAGKMAAETDRISQPQTPATATVEVASARPRQDQYRDALRGSDEIRLARAELKRKIGKGTVTASEVILTCPWEAASMTIAELLMSQRRWGATRCSKFLADIGMAESKTIGSMTERQRTLLASMV